MPAKITGYTVVLRATGSHMFLAFKKKLCLTAFSLFTNDHELALPLPAFPARVSISESVMDAMYKEGELCCEFIFSKKLQSFTVWK